MNNKLILTRQISGALKSAIAAHGFIHRKVVSSAAKRIAGNLNRLEFSYPDEAIKEKLLILMAEEHRDLELIRERFKTIKDGDWGTKARLSGEGKTKRLILIKLQKILDFSRDANYKKDTQLD